MTAEIAKILRSLTLNLVGIREYEDYCILMDM